MKIMEIHMENRAMKKVVLKHVLACLIYSIIVEVCYMLTAILEIELNTANILAKIMQFSLSLLLIIFVLYDLKRTNKFLLFLIPSMIFQPIISSIFYILLVLIFNGDYSNNNQQTIKPRHDSNH